MSQDAPPEALAATIDAFVRSRLSIPRSETLGFRLLSGGNSHITWRVTRADPAQDLVVKVAQPDGPLAPYDVGHEARMMQQARAAGVPAPELIGYLQDDEIQFLAMRLVAGESPSLWEVRTWLEGRPEGDRMEVARSLLSTLPILARASRTTASQFDIYQGAIAAFVDNLEQAAKGLIVLPPTIRAAQRWLLSKLPEMEAPVVLCHGDFRLGNAVFQDRRIVALLDWERAMDGHPLHDLGFLCLPAMKIGDHICGVVSQAELLALWPGLAGQPLDLRAVAYFRIFAIFGELCLMVRAMARLARGSGRLSGVRPLPLIARLHVDLVNAIKDWDNGDVSL